MTAILSSAAADGNAVAVARRDGRLVRFAIILTLGLLALRLLVASEVQLFFDEAYYWLWSTQLQASYYDHPPMVAIFIRLGTMIFGQTELGVRFVGTVSVAIDVALVYGLTLTLSGSRRTAAFAAIFMNVTTVAAFSVFIVPDQPMMLFWLAALYGLARIARSGTPGWWLFVGLMGGLAAASKFTTFFLALAVPVWLAVVPDLRAWFRRPWIYAGAAVALAVFLPVLRWNAAHDWASFALQFSREEFQFEARRFDSFVQYFTLFPLMATPPILILAVAGMGRLLRGGWRADPARALLLVTPVPLALYFAYHALGEWIGPHWIAPLVAMLAILAAFGVDRVRGGWWSATVRFCGRAAVPFGLAVSLLFWGLIVERWLAIPGRYDETARFRGWAELAANVEEARVRYGAAYVLGPDYFSPAYLRFYLDDPPPAFQIGDFERWAHFGGLGTAAPELAGTTGLYVGKWGIDYEEALIRRYFNSVVRARQNDVDRPIRPGTVYHWPIWLVSDPKPEAMALFGLTATPGE